MNILQLTTHKINTSSDTTGALASALCLAHCLLTPLIFLAHEHTGIHHEGHLEHHEAGPVWWGFIDYFFLGISFLAIHYSAKNTSLKWMPAALYISWALLAMYILIEKFHLFHIDHIWIYVPTLSLVFLHIYNRRYCNCEDDECCTD